MKGGSEKIIVSVSQKNLFANIMEMFMQSILDYLLLIAVIGWFLLIPLGGLTKIMCLSSKEYKK
ncbi:MAG: hypothetical protein PHN69_05465 [Candidatus Pacebacteria bacterium]|nr:hypothetical protein [Candidatus Paceibacterota bacterium]